MSGLKVKNCEEKENEMARGSYEAVSDSQNGLKHRHFERQRLWKLIPMVGLLVSAGTLIALHHIFNAHLNEKRIDPGTKELPSSLHNQRNVNIIETTIAHGVRIFLSMAIGVTFAQLFWETLRSRSFTIAQVDALVACGRSPFRPSALRAATASFALFIVSLVASATSLVVVLTPGSLTINSEFSRSNSCTVPTVPAEVSSPRYTSDSGGFAFSLSNIVMAVRGQTEYIPPYQTDPSRTCGDKTTSCSYNLTFAGPALDCIDITNETNFTAFLTPIEIPAQAPLIWDTTTYTGSGLGISILSRDLEKNLIQANNCTAYNATYDVGVTLHDGPATVEVWNVTLSSTLSTDECFTNDVGVAAIAALGSSCEAYQDFQEGCQWGSFFVNTLTGNVTFSDSVPHFVTSFVQNITLSFLSGNIYYGFGNDTATNLQYVESTCSAMMTVYVYNSTRLLATYGVAIAVSTLVTAYGCYLILRNDVERDLLLSQLASIVLNDTMLFLEKDFKKHVHGRTEMQLFRIDRTHQKLVLATPKKNGPVNAGARGAVPSLPVLTTYRCKMLLLVLTAVVCMILNHVYYRYLNGKAPNSSLRHSDSLSWTLDQTIVSIIGIALAYVGQTLFAVAIGASSTQILWRNMRHRGRPVDEVDSLMKTQRSPFSLSMFGALRSSPGTSLLVFLAASTTLISIFAPGSIKVASDYNKVEDCTVLTFRNLSSLSVNLTVYGSGGGNGGLVNSMASSGTYISPINMCGTDPSTSHCSYDLELVGPGVDCKYVTQPNNNTAFATSVGPNTTNIYFGQIPDQVDTGTDLWQMFVQSWDIKQSTYQNITCTGVVRSYDVSISHSTSSAIHVRDSRILSTMHSNMDKAVSVTEVYLLDIMNSAAKSLYGLPPWHFVNVFFVLAQAGGIGEIQSDGNITWNQNMPSALEEFVQNATLSLLSGEFSTANVDEPSVLENVTTKCTYTFTAYEYSPLRLFLTYGIGALVTILCVFSGVIAIRRNGVEESMDFSRFLRAILNERMYCARETLDKDTVVKADETVEGSIAPVDESS